MTSLIMNGIRSFPNVLVVVVVASAILLARCQSTTLSPSSLTDLPSSMMLEIARRLPLQSQIRLAVASPPSLAWLADEFSDKWMDEVVDPNTPIDLVLAMIRHYLPRRPTTETGEGATCPWLTPAQAVALYDRLTDPVSVPLPESRSELISLLIRRLDTALFFSVMIAEFGDIQLGGLAQTVFSVQLDPELPVVLDLLSGGNLLPNPHLYAQVVASLPPAVVRVVDEIAPELAQIEPLEVPVPAATVDHVRSLYPPPFGVLFPFNRAITRAIYSRLLKINVADPAGRMRPVLADAAVIRSLLLLGLRPEISQLLPHAAWLPSTAFAISFVDDRLIPRRTEIASLVQTGASATTAELRVGILRRLYDFGPLFQALPCVLELAPQLTARLRRNPDIFAVLIELLMKLNQWAILDEIESSGVLRYEEFARFALGVMYHLLHRVADDTLPAAAQPLLRRLFLLPQVGLYRHRKGFMPLLDLVLADAERFPHLLYDAEFLKWASAHAQTLATHFTRSDPVGQRRIRDWLSGRPDLSILRQLHFDLVFALRFGCDMESPLEGDI